MENSSSKEPASSIVNEQLGSSSTLQIVATSVNCVSKSWTLNLSIKSSKQSDNNWVTTFEASKESDVMSHRLHLDVVQSITENNEKRTVHIQELISDVDNLVETQIISTSSDLQESSADKLESPTLNVLSGEPQDFSQDASNHTQDEDLLFESEMIPTSPEHRESLPDKLESTASNIASGEPQDCYMDCKDLCQDRPSTHPDVSFSSAESDPPPWYVTRTQWGAVDPTSTPSALCHPIRHVVVADKFISQAHAFENIVNDLRWQQRYDMLNKGDISDNFYVGRDGMVYEGRGWEVEGEDDHDNSYQRGWEKNKSLSVSFLGYFNTDDPSTKEMEALDNIIERGLDMGKVARDYKIYYCVNTTRNLRRWLKGVRHFQELEDFRSDCWDLFLAC